MGIKKAIKLHGDEAISSILNEFSNLFFDKKALKCIMPNKLTQKQQRKLLRSHMFLKAKKDAKGNLEKIKSRLVGDGSQQDRTIYENKLESPTADI